jgi:hypothetical protein
MERLPREVIRPKASPEARAEAVVLTMKRSRSASQLVSLTATLPRPASALRVGNSAKSAVSQERLPVPRRYLASNFI